MTVTPPPVALREEDGALREDFVERVARRSQPGDRRRCCASWSATCTKPMSAP